MAEYFEGDINEFVDWISGYNKEEDTNHTNGEAVSGKSIRELLQGRLQRPVYMERDDVNGEIRLFSSEYAYNLWKDDPANHSDLMLGSFPIPHGYGIYLFDKDDDGNLIQTSLNNNLYLKYGDTSADANLFKKWFKVFDSNGEMSGKAVTAKLTITAPGFADDPMLPDTFNPGEPISFDISKHLHKGENTILVDLSTTINGRTYKESTLQYKVYVLELQASTPYQYNLSDGNQDSELDITLSVKNTNCSDYTAFCKIDDREPILRNISNSNEKSDVLFSSIDISDLSEGVHILQLKFTVTVLNNGIQKFIDSNIVYIRFVKYKSDASRRHNILTSISIDGSNGNVNEFLPMSDIPTLYLTQYSKFELNYSLASTDTSSTRKIRWDLKQLQEGEYVVIDSYESVADKEVLQSLIFTPTVYGEEGFILEGYLETDEEDIYTKELSYNLVIKKANIQITEKSGYQLKLENTSGYSNTNASNHKWIYKNIQCLFNRTDPSAAESPAFPWNSLSGWGKGCMHLSPGDYIFIDYPFFTSVNGKAAHTPGSNANEKGGITVEVEFEFKSVTNPNKEIIVIGGEPNKCKIAFTPNSAAIYSDSGTKLRETNFKANERIKLAFVIYPNAGYGDDTSLVTIVNNGIFERAYDYASNTFTSNGKMKIGAADAGADIYIYKIRAYDYALTNEELFCNFAIDSEDKSAILERNNILATNGSIDYKSTLNKLPVVLIKGNLQKIIENTTKDLNLNVDLSKIDSSDSSKDFYITNCRIRRHGQSTLNYPIPSFKIWSNSKFKVNVPDTPNFNDEVQARMYDCLLDDQNYPIPDTSKAEKYKGRYQMRNNSVPANKWVLQANYADSSGVHNGGIMRLIQEAWYNALVSVPGKNQKCYKLRTIPQLISSIDANRNNLDEDDFYVTQADRDAYNNWLQNKIINPDAKKRSMYEYNSNGTVRLWSECNIGVFPYEIKVAPDSFPCALFYRVSDNSPITFLGQYVFMDDKKSDFVFGERSIYKVKGDPFCQSKNYKDFDTDANRLWNNKNCVRVEIVQINTELVGYRSHTTEDGHTFGEIVKTYKMNENSEYVDRYGNVISIEQLESDGVETGTHPNWYNGFELIYPDIEEEDLKPGETLNEVLNAEMEPFTRFHEWITSTYQYFLSNGGSQALLNEHREDHNYPQNFIGFNEFQRTAKDHLDLYKLAAYYICFLRFGLVDSVERNAQPKTYDGEHWHYEPWDMDIALGNKNTGGIKWNPPTTRATNDGSIAAYSGTHIATENGQVYIDKSSWLWDALEAWDEFREVVKAVAEALSTTLTYANICKVLDEEYAAKWCERMYNISGHIKYIETQGANMYDWMQGARTSHRHWWLKTSMDYYDAKWVCGDFKNDYAYINIKHKVQNSPLQLRIIPSNEGYFCYGIEFEQGNITMSANVTHINGGESGNVNIPIGTNLETKSPFYIFGASNIKKLDLSNVYRESDRSGGIENLFLEKIEDTMKSLNIGVPIDIMEEGVVNANAIKLAKGHIRGVEELNIQGCNKSDSDYSSFLSSTEKLSKLYAIGTNLDSFVSNNYKDEDKRTVYVGGHYNVLQLPSTINTLEFHDTSWTEDNNETDPSDSVGLTFWEYDQNSETTKINKVAFADTYVKTLKFYGTTLRNVCAINLLKQFIAKAKADTGHTGEYVLYFENLNFDYEVLNMTFTYTELMDMAALNGGNNAGLNYKGYLKLSSIETENPTEVNVKTQNIIAAFGPNVFTKNSQSTNLVVDFRVAGANQIFTTLSDEGRGYFNASTGTVTEGYIDGAKTNPNYLIVRASRFLLPPNKPNQDICILVDGAEYQNYRGAQVVKSGDLKLLIPEMMRDPSTRLVPSSLRIKVTDHTGEDGEIIDTIGYADINIAHKIYPSSVGVSLVNQANYRCFTKKNASGNVEATLNTAEGVLTVDLNYPVNTADANKVSVKGIEITLYSESSSLSLTKNDDGSYNIRYNNNIPSSDNKKEFVLNCHVNYASGDDNDDFQIILTVMQDEAIVTNQSNSGLYNVLSNYVLNDEPVPCMYDTNNNKVFTRSSLNSIDDVIFYTDDIESTFYTALANLSSFLVDTGNTSKGNLFDYINNKTKVINLNGCTNAALASNVTTIDASRFSGSDNGAIYGLQQFICTTNALIEFIFVPNGTNSTLTNITITQGRKIIVKDLTRINPFNVQNARYIELENFTKISPSNFNLTLDVANLEKLYLNDVIKDTGGVKLLKYVYDYISQNPVPAARDISINWAGTINLTLQTSNPNISDFLDKLAEYIEVHGTSQITLNGFLKLDYHSKSLKQDIERYYPGNSLVSNWGTEVITIVPSSLENFVKGKIGNNINTSSLHDGNPNFHIDDIINEERDSSYAATSDSTERAQVRSLLWMLHVKGASLPQYVNMNTVFPNIDYLGWPSTGLSSTRDTGTGDSDYDFEFGRYGGLKAKVIVTTCTRPLHNRNNGGSTDLYYRMILFPLAYLNNWYEIISNSVASVQTGLTSESDKVTALASIHMYCKDENGVGYTETSLKNLTEEQLNEMLTIRGSSSFHHYEVGAKDGTWTVD